MSQILDKCITPEGYTRLKRFLLLGTPEGTYLSGLKRRGHIRHFAYVPNFEELKRMLDDVDLRTLSHLICMIQTYELDVHEEIIPLVLSECCKIGEWSIDSIGFALKGLKTEQNFRRFVQFGGLALLNCLKKHMESLDPLVRNIISELKSRDEAAAVEMACYYYSISLVHPTLQSNEEDWKAAIPNMDLIELMGWLTTSFDVNDILSPFAKTWDIVQTLSARLENRDAIKQSKIHPAYSLLLLQRLENPDLVKQQLKPRSKIPPLMERIKMIRSALESQMETAFANIKLSWMDISVVIDAPEFVGANRHNMIQQAALMSLSLKKSGNTVDIVTFDGSNEINLVSDETNNVFSMAKAIKQFHITPAIANIKKYLEKVSAKHLVVVIGSTINHEFFMETVNSHNYKSRRTKFVFCSLNGGIESFMPIDHERVLLTSGFDEKLVTLITGFGML